MNILELNFERTWRGGERQTYYNIEGFLKEGHQVTLLCRKGFPLAHRAASLNCTVRSYRGVGGILRFLATQGKKFDVIHAQTTHILTYCLLAKPFHRRKVVLSRRVDFIPRGLLTKLKYLYTDKIVAVSHAVKNVLEDFCGRKDIEVISDIAVYHPPDTLNALRILRDNHIPATRRVVGTIAALVPHKDPLTLVEAVRELSVLRTDFVLLHFGNGELEPVLQEKIKEYGLEKFYFPLGFVENVEDIFSVLEVFVMSSQEEGLGSSVLDAFLNKVPVVSTDAGGLNEIISYGRGIKCAKKDPLALAKGINDILSLPEDYRLMADKAYEYAHTQHSPEFITQRYLHTFFSEK